MPGLLACRVGNPATKSRSCWPDAIFCSGVWLMGEAEMRPKWKQRGLRLHLPACPLVQDIEKLACTACWMCGKSLTNSPAAIQPPSVALLSVSLFPHKQLGEKQASHMRDPKPLPSLEEPKACSKGEMLLSIEQMV